MIQADANSAAEKASVEFLIVNALIAGEAKYAPIVVETRFAVPKIMNHVPPVENAPYVMGRREFAIRATVSIRPSTYSVILIPMLI